MTASIGLETEVIICKKGAPVFTIFGQKTATYLLKLLHQTYGDHIMNYIKPELDSCQLEIINPLPHQTIDNAICEIQDILRKILVLTQDHDLHLSAYPFGSVSTDIMYADGPEKYAKIHNRLLGYGLETRNATNICGTHINIQTDHDFAIHSNISKAVADALAKKDFVHLGMHPVRYQKYKTTVQHLADLLELGDNITPLGTTKEMITTHLIDSTGRPYSSYELVRLKRLPSGVYLSELRTIDGPTGKDPVYDFGKKTLGGFQRLIQPYL